METLNSLRNRHTKKLINIEENKSEIITAFKTQQNWKPAHKPGKEAALKKLLSGCDDSSNSSQSPIGTIGSKSPVLNPSHYGAASHSYKISIEDQPAAMNNTQQIVTGELTIEQKDQHEQSKKQLFRNNSS